jgi:hypothetical protein
VHGALRAGRAAAAAAAAALALALALALLGSAAGCTRGPPAREGAGGAGGIASEALAPAGPPAPSGATLFERLAPRDTGIDFTITWDKPPEHDRIFYGQNTGGGVAIGDHDGDGLGDIYLTSPSGGNRLYRNLGGLRFEDVSEKAGVLDRGIWGTGASFVDLDQDGDLDLYACSYDSPNRLYVNRGDGTFEEKAKAFGLDYKGASVMMAFADYDLDGDLDGYLLTAGIMPGPGDQFRVRFEGNRPVVLERLQEFWQLAYLPGDRAKQLEAAQFDHLYRNEGRGADGELRFRDVSKEAGIRGTDFGQSATWWDYNDDGLPDLYVANDYWGGDYLYRNNGDGTFTDVAKTAFGHTPWSSMGSDSADIDGDGRLDLLATDMSGTTHESRQVALGDMESRGWFLEHPEPRQYPRNALYLNTGTERFLEAAHLAGLADTDWTWSVLFDDLDLDGRVDLFVTNGMTRDFTNADLNDAARRVAKEGTPEFFRFWREQDFRRDRNLAFRNLGDLRFEEVGAAWGLDHLGVSFGAATSDLDRDGDLDLVVNNMDGPAAVYRNRAAGGSRLRVRLRGTISNRDGLGSLIAVETAARKQVRYVTLARGWTSSVEPIAHFGLGGAERVDRLTVRWPSGHEQVFENLDAGRLYTITEPGTEPGTAPGTEPGTAPGTEPPPRRRAAAAPAPALFARSRALEGLRHREAPFDDFAREPLLPYKLSQLGPGLAWGDIDGDGDDDLYLSGARGDEGKLHRNQGGGRFERLESEAFRSALEVEEMAPVFLDADRDGDLDLYVVTGGVEAPPGAPELADRLYLNDGSGRFTRAPEGALPDLRESGGPAAAADFDRDGDLDLFVGGRSVPGEYPLAPPSRLLGNEGGRFADLTAAAAPALLTSGLVTAAVWSDADGDGWPDLLVAHEWGPVKLYRNAAGRLEDATVAAGLAARRGWWNGIAPGDLDGDGDMDYAVTGFGLNTRYQASPERPARLYHGDLDGSGRRHIVEAQVAADGALLPVRGKSSAERAMPIVGKRFPTYAAFARATLPEIYGERALEEAQVLEADTLESGVLWNDGAARFTFRPLPRRAQIAPSFGVAVLDADADGRADLYLAQNFYGPTRETGRLDGGVSLLLLGREGGGFEPAGLEASGLLVPGDARGATVTDLNGDGRPDIAVAVNDAEVLAFESARPGSWLAVRLAGPAGNPAAAGARVTLELEDGSTRTAEVHAGSGYLSQSSAVLYFGLGAGGRPRALRVRWPDGATTEERGLEGRQALTVRPSR